MKIVVGIRTKNEQDNIAHFCQSYTWADKILVADGGSWDDTVSISRNYPNVEVRKFYQQVRMNNFYLRNPHGPHLNFIIDWAKQEKADWLILDDCDCFPNRHIKENLRNVMENTDKLFIYITRLYLWKDQGHFPRLSKPRKSHGYTPSFYAFRPEITKFRFKEGQDQSKHQEFLYIPKDSQIARLMPPFALLHCPWQNDRMVEEKMKFYRRSGEVPEMQHPLQFGGKLEQLPEWAIE